MRSLSRGSKGDWESLGSQWPPWDCSRPGALGLLPTWAHQALGQLPQGLFYWALSSHSGPSQDTFGCTEAHSGAVPTPGGIEIAGMVTVDFLNFPPWEAATAGADWAVAGTSWLSSAICHLASCSVTCPQDSIWKQKQVTTVENLFSASLSW